MLSVIYRKINSLLIHIVSPYYLLTEKDEIVLEEPTDLGDFDF